MIKEGKIKARVMTSGCGEMADALDLGSSGRPWGFKSLHPHHRKSLRAILSFFNDERKMKSEELRDK